MSSPPTLAVLLEISQRLEITCHRCNQPTVVMSPEEAIEAFAADMAFVRLKRIFRCVKCGERGRDRMIDVRGSMADNYAARERDRHQRNAISFGKEQAELMRRPNPRLHSFTTSDRLRTKRGRYGPPLGKLTSPTIRCARGYSVAWPRAMIIARIGPPAPPSQLPPQPRAQTTSRTIH